MPATHWYAETPGEIVELLLEELGYLPIGEWPRDDIGDLYEELAAGDVQLLFDASLPGHDHLFETELADGSVVGDHVVAAGTLFEPIQGVLVDNRSIEETGLVSIDEINAEPQLVARFDADGNGKAEVLGCPDDWVCHTLLQAMLILYGWENIELVGDGHERMTLEATRRLDAGEPVLMYVWAPSELYDEMGFGERVSWLTMHPDVLLEDNSPLGIDYGIRWDQRPGATDVEHCVDPCQLGFLAERSTVSVNRGLLVDEPLVGPLLEAIEFSMADVSAWVVAEEAGIRPRTIAGDWIRSNRATVDGWIRQAIDDADLAATVAALPPAPARQPSASALLASGAVSAADWTDYARGREVVMGRANWASGYIQPYVVATILEQLGYAATDPEHVELSPDLGYQALANGDIDLWANGWFPGHDLWFVGDLPDGTTIGDHLTVVGEIVPGGGLEGIFIDTQTAAETGVTSVQDINDDPALAARFDIDGNGRADILGCPVAWTCDDVIRFMIAFYEWENIEQRVDEYYWNFQLAMERVASGDPVLAYTWAPTPDYHEAGFGENVMWISMHPTLVLDDLNYDQHDVAGHDQRPGGWAEHCIEPCQLGWRPDDISVVANSAFLADEPVIAELLARVQISVDDVSAMLAEADSYGEIGTHRPFAERWVEENQAQIDLWIVESLLAAGEL